MQQINNYKPLVLSKDNPFKDEIEKALKQTHNNRTGYIESEEVTIRMKRTYLPFPFVKLYQDKELLADLSPWACQILIYLSLNLEHNQERMKIDRNELRMDKRKYRTAMLELLMKRIIVETGKRQWYWINVRLLICGNLGKHE